MSNDKTAEEILSELQKVNDDPYLLRKTALQAMRAYSAQQLKEYKEVIRELLPILKSMKELCDLVGAQHIGSHKVTDLSLLTDKARKLIDQTDSTK